MKIKTKIVVPAAAIILVIITALFLRVFSVNVVFDRCLNADEVATAFQNTSFKSYQYSSVSANGSTLSMTGNSSLFGTPLEGEALEYALAEPKRTEGFIVIDGNATLLDLLKINKSPFVHYTVIYFPILDGGDRDIIPRSTDRFYENSPETRWW